ACALLFVVGAACVNPESLPPFDDWPNAIGEIILYAFFGALLGLIWAGFVTALTLPIVYLLAWSLGLRADIVKVGAFAGGLIGFICVLPLTLGVTHFDLQSDPWNVILPIAFGPVLTIILGQIGGAWGGSRSREAGPLLAKHHLI